MPLINYATKRQHHQMTPKNADAKKATPKNDNTTALETMTPKNDDTNDE
ncbi:13993_t:CDS:1, partial [Racocetra fulgida]